MLDKYILNQSNSKKAIVCQYDFQWLLLVNFFLIKHHLFFLIPPFKNANPPPLPKGASPAVFPMEAQKQWLAIKQEHHL